MKTVRCRRCKRHFEVMGRLGALCPSCIAEEEEVYLKVRAYVKDNPGVTVDKVSEALGVTTNRIISYVKEERLEITKGSKSFLACKNCGKAIHTGLFCSECKRVHGEGMVMSSQVEIARENRDKSSTQMHTARDYKTKKK